ncbi:syntaxin-1A-like [Protopterus annectens]|uniref:syntaxin-1A-like n=1 Tax=Protopterus annectens TaxID=7888 RepID=UPI001CFBE5F3|nr:syntaxin-1A-like [Protopterus annectens]
MKDRLQELRDVAKQRSSFHTRQLYLAYDNASYRQNELRDVDHCLKDISKFYLGIKELIQQSEEIDKKQQQVLSCTTQESICTEKKNLSQTKKSFLDNAQLIHSQLNTLEQTLYDRNKSASANSRIRQCQHIALKKQYQDVIYQHYVKETEYTHKLKTQIMRQAELAGLHLSQEDINVFVDKSIALQLVGHDLQISEAKKNLAAVEERQRQLLELESQITELHVLFQDFGTIVNDQQDVLNCIEYNVLKANNYTSQANEPLKKALTYQKKSRLMSAISAVLGVCVCCTCLSCVTKTLP